MCVCAKKWSSSSPSSTSSSSLRVYLYRCLLQRNKRLLWEGLAIRIPNLSSFIVLVENPRFVICDHTSTHHTTDTRFINRRCVCLLSVCHPQRTHIVYSQLVLRYLINRKHNQISLDLFFLPSLRRRWTTVLHLPYCNHTISKTHTTQAIQSHPFRMLSSSFRDQHFVPPNHLPVSDQSIAVRPI